MLSTLKRRREIQTKSGSNTMLFDGLSNILTSRKMFVGALVTGTKQFGLDLARVKQNVKTNLIDETQTDKNSRNRQYMNLEHVTRPKSYFETVFDRPHVSYNQDQPMDFI